jgi:hypothetical protein
MMSPDLPSQERLHMVVEPHPVHLKKMKQQQKERKELEQRVFAERREKREKERKEQERKRCVREPGFYRCHKQTTAKPRVIPTPAPTSAASDQRVPAPTPGSWDTPACGRVIEVVNTECAKMRNTGPYCVNSCEKLVQTVAEPEDLEACPVDWMRYDRTQFCWGNYKEEHYGGKVHPGVDCRPVMDLFCGKFKGMVFHNKNNPSETWNACETCVDRYFWLKRPVNNYGCWMENLKSGKYCPEVPGTTRYSSVELHEIQEDVQWLNSSPTHAEEAEYWRHHAI